MHQVFVKNNSIFEPVELTYSQLSSVDIQCNNLVKLYADNKIEEIKTEVRNKLLQHQRKHKRNYLF